MSVDSEIKELMGLFDVPAFARRGQDLEYALERIHARCLQVREESLEMVRLRLRQWLRVAAGPDDWSESSPGRSTHSGSACNPSRRSGRGGLPSRGKSAPWRATWLPAFSGSMASGGSSWNRSTSGRRTR